MTDVDLKVMSVPPERPSGEPSVVVTFPGGGRRQNLTLVSYPGSTGPGRTCRSGGRAPFAGLVCIANKGLQSSIERPRDRYVSALGRHVGI